MTTTMTEAYSTKVVLKTVYGGRQEWRIQMFYESVGAWDSTEAASKGSLGMPWSIGLQVELEEAVKTFYAHADAEAAAARITGMIRALRAGHR